jgi:hypothetical protein
MNELCTSYSVCAEHFERHYFMNKQTELVHNAVPTIFNHYSHNVDVPVILETLNRYCCCSETFTFKMKIIILFSII